MKKFICTVCGYIHEGDAAPEKCPLCKAPIVGTRPIFLPAFLSESSCLHNSAIVENTFIIEHWLKKLCKRNK